MKRDPSLIRDALLLIEALDIPAGATTLYYIGEDALQIDGHSDDAVAHHLIWLIDGGYIDGEYQNGAFVIRQLSWNGCELLDDVRDPEVWRRTKEGATKLGSWSIGVIAELAKAAVIAKAHALGIPIGN